MPIVVVQPEGLRIQVSTGSNLLSVIREAGVNIENICGGRGVCKKCVVEIISGEVSQPTLAEAEIARFSGRMRLACQLRVLGDVVVEIPRSSRRIRGKILEWGLVKELEFSPKTRRVRVILEPPSLRDQASDAERLLWKLNAKSIDSLLLRILPSRLREMEWKFDAIVHDNEVLDIKPQDDSDLYGVAVDVGTTTVVAYLVNLKTGKVVSVKSDYNGQVAYGDDVISRIAYALKDYEKLRELQSKVVKTINRLISEAAWEAGCSPSDVYEISLAGNTVMISILYGVEVFAIASAPYVPPFKSSLRLKAREIGISVNSSAVAYNLPLISGYVGGDVVADIISSGMHRSDEKSMLIDLGTNGEVIVKSGELMLAASTAAGPAIEGAGLSNGMRGVAGAIESLSIDPSTYEVYYRTIGDEDPKGICGSGVVDSIAWMLISNVLDRSGRIADLNNPRIINVNEEKAFLIAVNKEGRKICITQSDVRRFQLAKAAILAACLILLKTAGLKAEELSKVYVAGAFGNYVDPRSAMVVGMIPEIPLQKVVQIGNGSGQGAVMSILSRKVREEAEAIARRVRALELNTIPEFKEEFIDSTQFPHRNAEIFPRVIEALKQRKPLAY